MKTVVLVEFSWAGHHPTFFKIYARTLLELGFNVLALCPQPEEVEQYLKEQKVDGLGRLRLHRFFEAHKLPLPDYRLRSLAASVLSLSRTRKIIRDPKANPFGKPDLVIFGCIYSAKWVFPRLADWLLPYPWTGLFLQATRMLDAWHQDGWRQHRALFDRFTLLRARHCCAVLTLNELLTEGFSGALDGKPVLATPDATDLEPPDAALPLANEILRRANGRKIVGIFGNLCHDKGCLTLLETARLLDPSQYFFVLAGPMFLAPSGGAEDRESWRVHPSLQQENVFLHAQRLPDGSAYNRLVSIVDVNFLAYIDFTESSNNMVKAAYFQKPVIVSRGHLMEARVRKFRLGAVITQENAEECAEAIRELTAAQWRDLQDPLYHEFSAAHGQHALENVFLKLMQIAASLDVDSDADELIASSMQNFQ